MLPKLVIWFLYTKWVFAQLNGQFWWLNTKVSELNGKVISPPQYEDLTEFDTDETLIFFNDNVHPMKRKIINNSNNVRQFKMRPSFTQSNKNKIINRPDKIIFGELKMEDNNKFVWPSDDENNKTKFNNVTSTHRYINNDQTTKKYTAASTAQDQFGIKFPEIDRFYITEPTKTVTRATVSITQTTAPVFESTTEVIKSITEPIFFGSTDNPEHEKKKKSVCTYIKKYECMNHNGFIYTAEFGKSLKIGPKDPTLICCVLPLPLKTDNEKKPKIDIDSAIYFPDKISPLKRSRRSNDQFGQRNVLWHRRQIQETNMKSLPTDIVTAEDEEDPYWNIKNSFNPTKKLTKAADYSFKSDYTQEYADEIPRPGLLGLYSNSDRNPGSWSVIKRDKVYEEGTDYDDVDDSDTSFGYSTIDPRQDNRNAKKQRKPIKISTNEQKYNPESQIINFQSNPNFEVLHGFKLLNLVRNKKQMLPSRNNKKSEENDDSEDQESIISTTVISSENTDAFKKNIQLFADCGKTAMKRQKDTQIGDAEEGSHPWLVVVTPSNDQSDILCYGTLVHPRAAVTTAECVSEISPNGITVLAGLWKLNAKANVKKRTPQIHLHPKFKSGNAANNLAILTWSRPFKLCDEVQIACLAEPRQGNDCMLYGWGGFDQALRLRSRWQRAIMHACSQKSSNSNVNLPSNAFCASVQSRGTVSGIGGPLICNVDGRDAVVGVAVSRDTDVVFLPINEWAMQVQEFVNED